MKKVRAVDGSATASSISAQCGTRSPVSASISTVGEPISTESAIVEIDGSPVALAPGR